MGEGSKSGKLPAIGKFGLGLKSTFHLCEAFFYLASPEPPCAGGAIQREFVNPWADTRLHPEWQRELSAADVQTMAAALTPMVDSQSHWFCLWIPLRMQGQTGRVHPLIGEYPGDLVRAGVGSLCPDPATCLFMAGYDRRTASVMPLMKNLRRLRVWLPDPQKALRPVRCVALEPGSRTTRIESVTLSARELLQGAVRLGLPANEGGVLLRYQGQEQCLLDPRIEALSQSEAWPHHAWTDAETSEGKHEREKAILHVAVCLLSSPRRGQRTLRSRQRCSCPWVRRQS